MDVATNSKMVSNGSASAPLIASNKSGITLGVCSVDRRNVQGLIFSITALQDIGVDVVFKECPLTVRGLMAMDLNDIDVILLCHSLHLSHLALTDVQGSLYDEFLPKCRRILGSKRNVAVIVNDVEPDQIARVRLYLVNQQKKLYQNTSLVLVMGKLHSTSVDLADDQMELIIRFLARAKRHKLWKRKLRECVRCACCCCPGC